MMAENVGRGAQPTCTCVNWNNVQNARGVNLWRENTNRRFLTQTSCELMPTWLRSSSTGSDVRGCDAILGKEWRIYSLSPLYQFFGDPPYLAKYSRCLKASLREAQRRRADGPNSHLLYSHFSFDNDLTFCAEDPPALRIQVRKKRTDGPGHHILMEAFLIRVKLTLSVIPERALCDGLFGFPVMLVTGDKPMSTVLFKWLESHFGAKSHPLKLSDGDMRFMFALCSSFLPDTTAPPVVTKFSLEDGTSVKTGMETRDCKQLWERLFFPHPSMKVYMLSTEAESFVDQFMAMLKERTNLELKGMDLSEVGTPAAQISRKGKIKFFSARAMYSILHHLCQIAYLRVRIMQFFSSLEQANSGRCLCAQCWRARL